MSCLFATTRAQFYILNFLDVANDSGPRTAAWVSQTLSPRLVVMLNALLAG